MSCHDEFRAAWKKILRGEPGLSWPDVASRLEQYQKREMLGRMAGGMAQEFIRLLTTILGYEELALHALPAGHPLREYLVEIGKAAEEATRLTRQMAMVQRPSGTAPGVIEITSLVADAYRAVRSALGDIEIVDVHAAGVKEVRGSPAQLEQVLINLVLNARDAMPHGGRITLVSENVVLEENLVHRHGIVCAGPYVRLTITDTGCGMDEATLARLFEPFFTTKEREGCTGLGLAISWQIVQRHGGQIVVASHPGRGSMFALYLPQLRPEANGMNSVLRE